MRTATFSVLIDKSLERSKVILFKPFLLRKWITLAFIALMASALGMGNGGNFGRSSLAKKAEAAPMQQIFQEEENIKYDIPLEGSFGMDPKGNKKGLWDFLTKPPSTWSVPVFIFLGITVLALMLLLAWLGARFKFLWFEAIATNDAKIIEPFGRYEEQGNSLFKFLLIVGILVLLVFGGVMITIPQVLKSSGVLQAGLNPSLTTLIGVVGMPIVLLFLCLVGASILTVIIDHFIVTIMAMDRCLFTEAWGKFVELYKNNVKDFWLYLLVLLGLGIVCWLLLMALSLIVVLAILLVGGIIAAILFFLCVVLLKSQIIFIIFAILFGVPVLAAGVMLIWMVQLPVSVFFKNLSLYYISSLDAPYKVLEV